MGCACKGGAKKGAATVTKYEVRTPKGTQVVDDMATVRTTLRNEGGGSYRAVQVKRD